MNAPVVSDISQQRGADQPVAPPSRPEFARLETGDPAPWFTQRAPDNPTFRFHTLGGFYVVLCFYGSVEDPRGREAINAIVAQKDLFESRKFVCLGVSTDPRDEAERRVSEVSGLRLIWDFDRSVSRMYGAAAKNDDGTQPLRQFWVVTDPSLRVISVVPFASEAGKPENFLASLRRLPPPHLHAGFEIQAPVLIVPNVFEPDFCRHLIQQYETHGGVESGFMREVDGKTVAMHDHKFKRRKDFVITDRNLIDQTRARIRRRIIPEIQKVHFFSATRMERYIVSCYAAEDEAHFNAHRDNTTAGTAHRRFAVSINLNSEFDGGQVSFPEYGPRSYKAPVGGAVVFSCALLHAVSQVTRGRRYAFLPFLYDDEAAKIRQANNDRLGEGVTAYRG